jgi:ATP phosphoribosyltransferase
MLTIALSKGRILKQTLPLLKKAGLEIADKELNSRKLILDTNLDEVKVIVIRATDVPVFVQHGAADMGIAGKDVLLEHGANGLFELLDLNIAQCKLMVAASDKEKLKQDTLKIATKYVNSAKRRRELMSSICSRGIRPFALSVLPVSTKSTIQCAKPTTGASSIAP